MQSKYWKISVNGKARRESAWMNRQIPANNVLTIDSTVEESSMIWTEKLHTYQVSHRSIE